MIDLTQTSDYPEILGELVFYLSYKPGWKFTLQHRDRGQGSVGLTLCILITTPDSGWHDEEPDGDESCPILFEALLGTGGPIEWGHDFETGEWVCTKFVGPCSCGITAG